MVTVIYHDKCSDGACSAWVIRNYFQSEKVSFIPYNHGDNIPSLSPLEKIYMVDCSYSKEKLQEFANKITILDHHASNKRELENLNNDNITAIFDMNRCGAELAWDYFFPNKVKPWFLDMISDHDLWKERQPWTKILHAATLKRGYHTIDGFDTLLSIEFNSDVYKQLYDEGVAILEEREKQITEAVNSAYSAHFKLGNETYTVKVYDCHFSLRSDVGNRLCENTSVDFAISVNFDSKANLWRVSARKSSKSPLDLSILMKNLSDGGGHPSAAGGNIKGNLSDYILRIN